MLARYIKSEVKRTETIISTKILQDFVPPKTTRREYELYLGQTITEMFISLTISRVNRRAVLLGRFL